MTTTHRLTSDDQLTAITDPTGDDLAYLSSVGIDPAQTVPCDVPDCETTAVWRARFRCPACAFAETPLFCTPHWQATAKAVFSQDRLCHADPCEHFAAFSKWLVSVTRIGPTRTTKENQP